MHKLVLLLFIWPLLALPGVDVYAAETNSRAQRSEQTRSLIVESSLRDINRSLEVTRPQSPAIPAPRRCPTCGERAQLPQSPAPTAQQQALRGNLHRLKRETAQQQTTSKRRSQIEAAKQN